MKNFENADLCRLRVHLRETGNIMSVNHILGEIILFFPYIFRLIILKSPANFVIARI